jgi:hypothetical protein
VNRIRFLNPRSDRSFVGLVESVMQEGVRSRQELEARLRAVYPAAVVRERGLSGDVSPIWYVYRDGRWTPDAEDAEEER